MDGRTGEEECGVNEEKSRGDFIMKCLLALIRMIYTALCCLAAILFGEEHQMNLLGNDAAYLHVL